MITDCINRALIFSFLWSLTIKAQELPNIMPSSPEAHTFNVTIPNLSPTYNRNPPKAPNNQIYNPDRTKRQLTLYEQKQEELQQDIQKLINH